MNGLRPLLRQHPSLRRAVLPLRWLYYRRSFYFPPPKVLANSLPKAGTNLLSALLRLMPKMVYSGVHDALDAFHVNDRAELDWTNVASRLQKVRNGQFATGHFPALPEFIQLTRDLNLRTIVIFRDPRDMALSNVFYVLSRKGHPLHDRFVDQFTTFEERLLASISGFPDDERGPGLPSVGERLDAYWDWFQTDNAHTSRFEDLVGPDGGGNADRQRREILRLGNYIDRELTPEQADRMAARMWNPKATTFRKGEIGDWRNYYDPEHTAAFKSLAGSHLIRLGYERGLDW